MLRRKPCREIAKIFSSAAAVLALGLTVSGCAGEQDAEQSFGEVGYLSGFFGGVAADEPTAALAARDVLTSGGTAVDAAVAMGFALSVTYPNAVSLGGGGVCVVHDAGLGVTEAIDFIPPAASGASGDRPTAIPTLTRGLVAMHARYGRLDWRRVVAPAEQMARFGHRVSRAFASRLAPAAGALFRDPQAREIFTGADGTPYSEGERIRQADLAGVLGRIRGKGGGALYSGQLAERIVEAYRQAGGTLTRDDLRAYQPEWRTTVLVPFPDRNMELHFAPPPAAAGVVEAQIWRMLESTGAYEDLSETERRHLQVETSRRALADRQRWLPSNLTEPVSWTDLVAPEHIDELMSGYRSNAASTPDASVNRRELFEAPAGTGFVVADRDGMAVACSLSNFYPFGIGRIAPGTGIFPAAAPDDRGRNPLSMGPMMAVQSNSLDFRFAAAASGGSFAQASLTQVMAGVLLRDRPAIEANAAKRVLGVDQPALAVVEAGADSMAEALRSRGHKVEMSQWPGRVSAIHCPKGLPSYSEPPVCAVTHDPRGFGLSAVTSAEE